MIATELATRHASGEARKTIFYHLHIADSVHRIGFQKAFPNHKFIYTVRNPTQALESWMLVGVKENFNLTRWKVLVERFDSMAFSVLLSPFERGSAVGIRLEDIKVNPKETMAKVSEFMSISYHEVLYRSEFCGLRYWGPYSPDLGRITGFDISVMDRPTGRLFGVDDIKIFETIFRPF